MDDIMTNTEFTPRHIAVNDIDFIGYDALGATDMGSEDTSPAEDGPTDDASGDLPGGVPGNEPIAPPSGIFGTENADTLNGTDDADVIFAGDGDDLVDGGDGDDLIAGEAGNDTMAGGDGNDTFLLSNDEGSDVITDFTPGEDILDMTFAGFQFDDLSSEQTSEGLLVSWGENSVLLEGVTEALNEDWFRFHSDSASDPVGIPVMPTIDVNIIEGTDEADTLAGTSGPDHIYGLGGDDELSGSDGEDVLSGGEGNDTLTGGDGADYFSIASTTGNDVVTDFTAGEDFIDMMATGLTFDDLSSEATADGLMISWDGGSLLLEGISDDLDESWFFLRDDSWSANGTEPAGPGMEIGIVEGSNQADDLSGTDGVDFIYAYDGADLLDGGEGGDILNGGAGNDTMTGGEGADIFMFDEPSGNDTITDFTPGEDVMSFSTYDLSYEDLSASTTDGGTLLSWEGGSIFLEGVTEQVSEDWFNFMPNPGDNVVGIAI